MLHFVQIGRDPDLLNIKSEVFKRHSDYVELIGRRSPGARCTFFALDAPSECSSLELDAMRVIPIAGHGIRAYLKLYIYLVNIHAELPISLLISQTVHEDGWFALLWGWTNNVRVLGQIHYDIFSKALSIAWKRNLFPLFWVRRQVSLFLLRFYSALRVVNSENKMRILSMGYAGDIAVIPVPMVLVNKNSLHERADIFEPTILFVGRLSKEKNPALWVDIVAQVQATRSNIKLVVVGEGPENAALQKKCERMNLRVSFVGKLSSEDLQAYYLQSFALLVTSFYEGFGRVIAEAMAHGLPVFSTPTAGAREIIENSKTGFIGGAAELPIQILALLEDNERHKKISEACQRESIGRYNYRELCNAWVNFLHRCATSNMASIS